MQATKLNCLSSSPTIAIHRICKLCNRQAANHLKCIDTISAQSGCAQYMYSSRRRNGGRQKAHQPLAHHPATVHKFHCENLLILGYIVATSHHRFNPLVVFFFAYSFAKSLAPFCLCRRIIQLHRMMSKDENVPVDAFQRASCHISKFIAFVSASTTRCRYIRDIRRECVFGIFRTHTHTDTPTDSK